MKHPTLEGHPAWEAFKRAPMDTRPFTESEAKAVEEARRGEFSLVPPFGCDVEEA